MIDLKLVVVLIALLGVMQGFLLLSAWGLGRRLSREVIWIGLVLPLLILSPWLLSRFLLAPLDVLQDQVPGAPQAMASGEYMLLNDVVLQMLPWELEVRHALAARRLPLWSDLLDGGSSPWVNPQAGVLSPISWLARGVHIQHFLLVALALKILVGFQGTWLLARRVGARRMASILAALGFVLGGGLIPWALFPHTATVVWVPWLTVGVIQLFRHHPPRVLVTTALLTAVLLLSGHPEVAAIGGLFALVCGVSLRRRRRSLLRRLGGVAAVASLGFGLAAPHVVPFLSMLPMTHRAQETLVEEMPSYRVEVSQPKTWFLPGWARFVLAPTNPHAYGRPFQDPFNGPFNWLESGAGYAGLVALAGALVALLGGGKRRAWPFLAFAGVSLLLAGKFLPLAHLIYGVPFLKAVAYPRFLLVSSLALCVAGGLGVDEILRSRGRKWAVWCAVVMAAGLSLAVRLDLQVLGLWVLLILSAALAGFRRRLALAGFVAVLLLDQGVWARRFLPSSDPALFYPVTSFIETLRAGVSGGHGGRVVGQDQIVYPSLLSVYGLANPLPHNPMAPMGYLKVLGAAFGYRPGLVDYFASMGNPDHPFLDFLNVRLVVSSFKLPQPRTLERIDNGRFGPYRLYENPDPLPRWFVPSEVEIVDRTEIESWIATLKDPRQVALFSHEMGDLRMPGLSQEGTEVELIRETPGDFDLRLALREQPTVMATSFPRIPGWQARAPGVGPLQVITVNGAFVGVLVPPHVSQVRLRFVPSGLAVGLGLCLLSGILLAALLLREVPRRRFHGRRVLS